MINVNLYLLAILIASCSLLPLPFNPMSAQLELYGNFHTMGITVSLRATDDPTMNAVATVEYRLGNYPYRSGFPLTRTSSTRFTGSLFWLQPGTAYTVRVTFRDPDGDPINGVSVQATATTRTGITIPAPNHSFFVMPDGISDDCSWTAPCSLPTAVARAQPGDEIVLRGGVYYQGEITLPRSGAPGAPIVIRSRQDETAIVDGADPTPLQWTPIGNGLYRATASAPDTKLVIANGERLYPYPDLPSLQSLSWSLPGFYSEGQTLYLHLTGDSDPNQAEILVSRFARGFNVKVDYIYFLNLTFRHFGQENETRAIYFNDASNNLVQDSTFALNNGGITIKGVSHRNVIQNNEFYDTTFTWPWDAVKAASYLERGGVFFASPAGGRGNIIRRNIFHDFFDGFDTCASEATLQTTETDVYDNLIYNTGDDGLQVDGSCSNLRIWHNTFHDVLAGVSFAPTIGGPVYVLRNLIYHFGVGNNDHEGRSFKFNSNRNEKSGYIYLLHNTIDAVTPDAYGLNLSSGSSDGWELIYARNNSWSSPSLALRNDNIGYPTDLDYNNLWSSQHDELVRWNDTKYSELAAFTAASGQEAHGYNVDPLFVAPDQGNYSLAPASPLVDAGVLIPGINDAYLGTAPDIGAFESTANAPEQIHLPFVQENH
ncbi:MAG: right-handed parallel beta-helix repeat-containing protein [Caldilineaceae bacterium]